MTIEEKRIKDRADEIHGKMFKACGNLEVATFCSIVSVQEIMKGLSDLSQTTAYEFTHVIKIHYDYWNKVKSELEKY